MKIKGWHIVNPKCPHFHRKIKKNHYRLLLISGGIVFIIVHRYAPDYDVHAAAAWNTLFALDPTV
jgi:hypothetical protein